MKNYSGSLKANLESRKEVYKRRAIYFFSFTLLVILVFFGYFLLTGKQPLSLIPATATQKPSYNYSIYGGGDMGELKYPLGIAVLPDQSRVYVTDSGNQRVAVFNKAGKPLFTFNKIGKTTLQNPIYIKDGPDGNVYVSDTVISRICIFNKDGKFLRFFKTKERFNPLGITFGKNSDVYIADKAGGRVIELSLGGKLVRSYGEGGKVKKADNDPNKLYFPNNVLVLPNNKILVADSNNQRILAFEPNGKPGKPIPINNFTRGLALTDRGYVLTAKSFLHQIVAVNLNGEFLYTFGEEGPGDGQFLFPNDVAVVKNSIYIVDTQNNRVQVWSF